MTMKYKCAFSGSGGQGAALMAKLTCMACITEKKQVVMTQTYGVEQRGGDSTGYVVISDQPISNPIVESDANVAVALSESIYQSTLDGVCEGGTIFVNSSMVKHTKEKPGVTQVLLPVSEMAQDMGNIRVANIIMLGAVIRATGMLGKESVADALANALGKKAKTQLLEVNMRALQKGVEVMEKKGGGK